MKIRLKDLADELGLSIAAVSMSLNNKKGVSDETRDRVIEAAVAKGYKIKEVVTEYQSSTESKQYIKLLRIQKHGLVAIDTAFFSRLIEGIEKECRKNNYELLVSNCKLKNIEAEWIEGEFENNISGMFILATELEHEDVKIFDSITKPFVILDSYFPGKEWDFVLMNNHSAFYESVEYLKGNGHTEIGYIKSSTPINNFNERFSGYLEALNRFDLKYDSDFTVELEPTLEGAYRDMNTLLKEGKLSKMPTAYIADNDLIAVGAMDALKENGYSIPEDISIIGFDDMPYAQVVSPKLTTNHVFKSEIGREAFNLLLDRMSKKNKVSQKREINTKLVLRDSVKSL